ncbi:hypothetical protein [Variovorax terrae]|uniref:Uncharacterized protein n=1 Tax=Variovorax terrae TaxID=2923278 RepID=A0A9X1VTA7_9BURK|nr:hypothetical protein [Variovorax terrae]MCJ0762913.1 hypothetical protein [Variovorax terrae]
MTASALLEILERIQPEVVFAEIPRTHIDAWRDGSHETVESIAIARYADTHSFDTVAVDSPKPDDSFFQGWKEVSRAIERTSPEFRRLMDLETDRARQGGFTYLNSDECIQAWADIYREMLGTIEYIGNSRLRKIYAQARDLMERRDLEMLGNIRAYCASTARTCGVFLVGTAHRKSLIEKLHAAGKAAGPRIEWDVGGSVHAQSAGQQ